MKASENTHELPPFPAFPCVSRYVPVGSAAEALDRVRRSIKSNDGISLVIGPPGTGKSLLSRVVAEEFRETHDVVVLGDAPIDDAADFHRHLLHHLGADLSSVVDGDLHLALIDRVCGKKASKRGLLIIVDEAQSLSADVLEAVRMATNIMRDHQPRVAAVLCGGVKLDDTLTAPSLEPFTQRVSTRCYLHPLNAAETRQYIRAAIRACESNPDDTITDEAIGAIHHACSGVPRLINQIMTEAIDCAADNDQDLICEKMVDLAWAQLQQLPSPMVEERKIAHNTAPVEFGTLSDLDSHSRDAANTLPQAAEVDEDEESMPAATVKLEDDACWQTCDSTAATVPRGEDEQDEPCLTLSGKGFADMASAKPLPASLFGEFEIEEPVQLGNGIRVGTTTETASPPGLEAMIHSEIVSLSELAAEARFGCSDCGPQELVSVDLDRHSVIWTDEPENESQSEDLPQVEPGDIVLSTGTNADDSDLLVIEEDIDIESYPGITRVDSKEQTISVDFHRMLNSMRKN